MTYRALILDAESRVVGTAKSDVPDEPVPAIGLDQHSLVEVPVQYYDKVVAALVTPSGAPRWQWTGTGLARSRVTDVALYLVVRRSDGMIVRTLQVYGGAVPGEVAPTLRLLEVDGATFESVVAAGVRYDEEGPLRWRAGASDALSEVADGRFVLSMSHSGDAAIGTPTTLSFELRNAAGDIAPITDKRKVQVLKDGVPWRPFLLGLSGGLRTLSYTFNEAGVYELASADPETYRVEGPKIDVSEVV